MLVAPGAADADALEKTTSKHKHHHMTRREVFLVIADKLEILCLVELLATYSLGLVHKDPLQPRVCGFIK